MTFGQTITREFLRQHNACYSDERLAELVPPEGLTTLEVLRRTDVPVEGRIWVATREGAVPTGVLQRWAIVVARRALGRIASPDPRSVAALDTAEAYLDGRARVDELDAAVAAARPMAALYASLPASWSASWSAVDAARAAVACSADVVGLAADATRSASWSAAWPVAQSEATAADVADAEREAQVADLSTLLGNQP